MLPANFFLIPQAALLSVLPHSRQSELRGCVEMRGGWGQEQCHASISAPHKLLMYASVEPCKLSNYWITARSEVVTSKTEGDYLSVPLWSEGPFMSVICGRGQRDVQGKPCIKAQEEKKKLFFFFSLLPLQSLYAREGVLLSCVLWQQHW